MLSSVYNATRVLDQFSLETPEWGITELSKQLHLSKSSVHNLVSTLVKANLLEQNTENQKYRLGLKVFELGNIVRHQMTLHQQSLQPLRELVSMSDETAHIAILDKFEVVYVEKMEGTHAIRMYSQLGGRAPAYCTGVGKVLLAFQPQEMLENGWELKPYTKHTITSMEDLKEELAIIRKRGYALDNEEIEIGLRCVAAPIRNYSGTVIASISVAGPSQRVTDARIEELVPMVIQKANEISQRLGYLPSQM